MKSEEKAVFSFESQNRGHTVYAIVDPENPTDTEWRYTDTDELANVDRPCKSCGRTAGENDHDPCIANLPGVKNACCGHGDTEYAYVQFSDESRETLREADAVQFFAEASAV